MICGGAHPIATYPGQEGYLTTLQQRIQALGIGSHVVITGHVDRTRIRHYNIAADIHAAPSVIDTFNYSPVEAALAGTFALVSDMTGCGPWLEQAGAGKIVPGEAKEAWATALVDALSHPTSITARQHAAQALRALLGVNAVALVWSDWLKECASSQDE